MAFDAEIYKKRVYGDSSTPEEAAAPAEQAPAENETEKGFLDRPILDSINNFADISPETRQNLYDTTIEDAQHIDINPEEYEENPGVDEEMQARHSQAWAENSTRQNLVEYVEGKAADPKAMEVFRELHTSALYQNYIMTPEEKFNKAREISKETGLTTEAILSDNDTYKNSLNLYDYIQKQKAAMGPGRQLDFNAVLEQFPELKGIADLDDDQMVAALHDMKNIRELHEYFNDNKSLWQQYSDYAKKNWQTGKENRAANLAYYDVSESKYGYEGLEKAKALQKAAQENALQMPNMFDDPLKAAIYGVGNSLPDMIASMLEGTAGYYAGGAMGLATGTMIAGSLGVIAGTGGTALVPMSIVLASTVIGAKLGFGTGMFNGMRRSMQGQEYARLRENMVDTNPVPPALNNAAPYGNLSRDIDQAHPFFTIGNKQDDTQLNTSWAGGLNRSYRQAYTHLEMQDTARKVGAINAGIETASDYLSIRMLMPTKVFAEKGFISSLKNLSAKTKAKEEFFDTTKKAGEAAAAGLAKEEGKKAASKVIRENITKEALKDYAKEDFPELGKGILKAGFTESLVEETAQDIAPNLLENELKARTGRGGELMSAGEIISSGANSGIQSIPAGLGFGFMHIPTHFVAATTGVGARIKHETDLMENYTQQARHTILGENFLAGIQRIVTDSKLKDTDAELQKKLIREQAAGTGFEMVYIDTASVLENENGMEQLQKIAKAANIDDDGLQEAIRQGNLNVAIESFAQSEADSSVLTSTSFDRNADSIAKMQRRAAELAADWKAYQENYQQDVEKLRGVIARQYFPDDAEAADEAIIALYDNPTNPMQGLKDIEKNLLAARDNILQPAMDVLQQGFGERPDIVVGDDGRGVRVSNNAPWYQKWFKENNRQITKADLVELATAMVTGEGNVPEVEGWSHDASTYEAAGNDRETLKAINDELAVVARAKEKIGDLSSSEVKNAIGLSEEGFAVYRAIKDQLLGAPGTSSRAARVGAILFARHADRMAERMQKKGNKNYTAVDYFNRRFRLEFGGDEQAGGLAQMMEDVGEDNLIYRYTNTPNALSDYGHAMFSDAKEQTFSNYKYISVVNKDELLDIDEFLQLLAERIEEDAKDGTIYSYPQYMQDSLLDEDMELDNDKLQKFLEEYNPVDIVNSADAWDNKDFVNLAMEVASFNEVKGIKTSDGGIVFDDSIIKTFDNTKEEYKQTTMSIPYKTTKEKNGINVYTKDVTRATGKEAKKAAEQAFREKYPEGKKVDTVVGSVGVSSTGVHNSLAHGFSSKKLSVVPVIPETLESAKFMESIPDYDNKKITNHFFVGEVNIDNIKNFVLLRIREQGNDRSFYIHEVGSEQEIKEKSDSLQTQAATQKGEKTLRGIALYVNILQKYINSVNAKDALSNRKNNLVAYHNTTAAKLSEALRLGGIPVPSIAITNKNNDYSHFGDITLVAPKEMVDPAGGSVDVYNRDAYTVRGPEYRLHAINKAETDKVMAPYVKDIEKLPGGKELLGKITETATDITADIEKELTGSDTLFYYYLTKVKNVKPDVQRKVRTKGADWANTVSKTVENYRGKMENGFRIWAYSLAVKLKPAQVILDNGKEIPYNLENIVDFMVNKHGAAEIGGWEYNTGKVAAAGAKKLESINEMHANESSIRSNEEMQQIMQELDKNTVNVFEQIKDQYGDDSEYLAWQGCLAAIAKSIEGGKTATKESIAENLDYFGYSSAHIGADIIAKVVEAANKIKDAATWYFEAKPQRAVQLNEFAGAVVPADTDANLIQQLKDAGLQVETYDADIEGDRQRATQKIQQERDVLFQGIKGSTTKLADGKRLIQLFESADESTFLHEMGHLFLMDLEELAQIDEVSAKELQEVMEWAEWHEGDYRKYAGTAWSKEFADREQAIIDAQRAGDVNEADRLKRVWMHERFARGFELYLRDGKAPSKGLRAVFRAFGKFLRQVYAAFLGEGARASAEVEKIMGRMIATDEEIEAMAMEDQFKDFEKAGGEKLLNETERETYERWLNEAKEEAREKLHKIVMKDLTEKEQKEFEDYIRQEEAAMRLDLEQLPVNLARKAIEAMGGDKQAALVAFPSVEEFEKADKEAPSIEQALKEYLDDLRDFHEKQYVNQVINEETVREAMESSEYHHKAKELEAAALARKLDAKRKINQKAEQAIQGIQDALDAMPEQYDLQNDRYEAPVKAIMAKINQLRFSTKWSAKDFAEIEKMIKAATKEELQQQIDNFKQNMKQQSIDMKSVERANEGRLKLYAQIARDAVSKEQIFNATNVNEHRRQQRSAEAKVKAMIKAGNIQQAISQQQAAALSAAMAKEAAKAKEHVDKLVAAINRQLSAKSVKLPAKERYWHRHLAYLLRIGEVKDPDKPVLKKGQNLGSLRDLIEGYQSRLDLQQDFDVDAVMEIIDRNQGTGYRTMNIAEFEKVADLMGIIYKCGKDEFSLKTIAGKTVDEAVNEIIRERSLADNMSIDRRRIQDNTGGLGWNDWMANIPVIGEGAAKMGQSYLSISMKPEKLIELLGEKAHRYIYGTFDKAVNDEAEMMAKATQDVQNILAGYSHKERQAWKDYSYELKIPAADGSIEAVRCSKENLICMALNLGTTINRQRLTGGFFGPEVGETEEIQLANQQAHTKYLMQFLTDNLQKKDWEMVQGIWDYLDTYWADTARVEEELNGMHLEKQKAVAFSVMTPEGEVINMKGGYYPIKYNPDKDDKAAARAQDDVVRQMGGSQKVLGTGRSHVKSRSEADVFHELQLTFDIIPSHIQQVIHNITTRLAARDVYRLLNNDKMTQYIEDHMGAPYRDLLRQWALDVWTQLPEKDAAAGFLAKAFSSLRRNSTFAIMAYRVWPALENLSNIGPVADKLGYMNALGAVTEFYGHMSDFRRLMDKSVLMRNRINNMDRDIRSQPGLFAADNKVMETIREHGYDLMTYSDLMFSAPLWCRAYKQAYMEQYRLTYAENEANKKKQQEAQAELDRLRGAVIDAKKDIQNWHDEKRNRAKAGQAGWQPGTSRFSVMPGKQFSVMLPELQAKLDELNRAVWDAEAEQGHAAEIKILQGEELIKEAERRAVAKADAAVRDAFGSGRTVDLAAVSRTSDELTKSMTTFFSFFNTQFNSIYFKYLEGKYGTTADMGSWEKMQAWMPFAKAYLNRVIITSLIGSLLKMATKTDGDDDKDKYRKVKGADGKTRKEEIPWLERFLKVFGKNTLSMTTGAFYGFRDAANLALNLAFDGTDYGRGLNVTSTPLRSLEEAGKTIKLVAKRSEHNAKIDEQEAAQQEKLKKMTRKQRQKWEEEQKYKKPQHRITYAEIFRHGANALTGLSAATTGISSTLIDSVTGTMQYMLDTENRYDANWRNLIWSAIFDKKPVEREVPQKPEQQAKKKRKK